MTGRTSHACHGYTLVQIARQSAASADLWHAVRALACPHMQAAKHRAGEPIPSRGSAPSIRGETSDLSPLELISISDLDPLNQMYASNLDPLDYKFDIVVPQVTDLSRERLPVEVKGDNDTALAGARRSIRQSYRRGLVLSRTKLEWEPDIAILPVWVFLSGLCEQTRRTITLG